MADAGEPSREIAMIPTGAANTASVRAALERQGTRVRLTAEAHAIAAAPGVVLPGVGAFGPAMRMLREHGLVDALRGRIESDRPTLCVCLGMQLLAAESEESPGVQGLGVLDTAVARFDARRVPVPQLGWNHVTPDAGCGMLAGGAYYFANSFRVVDLPAGWSAAESDYAGPFVAAVERGSVLACQFHPELSGGLGAALLGRWLARVAEAAAC